MMMVESCSCFQKVKGIKVLLESLSILSVSGIITGWGRKSQAKSSQSRCLAVPKFLSLSDAEPCSPT